MALTLDQLTPEEQAGYKAIQQEYFDTNADWSLSSKLQNYVTDIERTRASEAAQVETTAAQDAFMESPEVVNAVNQFKANPTDQAAWGNLSGLLANAPTNYLEMGDPTATQAKYGRQEYLASEDIVNKYPEIKDAFYAAGERFNPQGNMMSMQNLGPALAIAGMGLGAGALGGAMAAPGGFMGFGSGAGLAAGGATPLGYGVGGAMTNAAGLTTPAGLSAAAAVPSIANAPVNLLSSLPQTPSGALTGAAPAGTPSIGTMPAAPTGGAGLGMPASPTASMATPAIGSMGTGLAAPALSDIGSTAASAGSLIPGISNQDLLNTAGTLASSGLGYFASGQAADTQSQAADRAAALSEPWRQTGMGALGQLETGTQPGGDLMRSFTMDDFQTDPGAQYRREMGRQERENWAAQTGNIYSGEALLEAERQGQGLAAQEYGQAYNRFGQEQANRFNRLSGLAGTGQAAAQQVGGLVTDAGAARAAGQMGQANALSGGIGQSLSMYNTNKANQQNIGMQNQWLDYLRRA